MTSQPVASAADRLAAVRARVAVAARAAGRDPAAVCLVAVSKYHPAADVRALAAAGQRTYGESRAQDLRAKRSELGDLDLSWHFVGRLQTNKAAVVAGLADLMHSLDRAALVSALAKGAADREGPLRVLLQVSLDGDPDRGGALPAELAGLAELVAAEPTLDLAGLMAVAVAGLPPGPQFDQLAVLAADLRADHPGAAEISAGMSADLEAAIAAGATLVRVGTALFRPGPVTAAWPLPAPVPAEM